MSIVLQEFALFPHLSVEQNISYGMADSTSSSSKKIIDELLELTQLGKYAKRMPSQLSGGQQQRVAIARALAVQPKLLLLDEPFSNLDKNLADSMKVELKKMIQDSEVSALLITHDQEQAFDLGHTIALMSGGKLIQHCNAFDLYHKPSTKYAAKFILSLIHI